jgi:hypothetical protein
MADELAAADFRSHLGERFGFRAGDEEGLRFDTTLMDVAEHPERRVPGGRTPFTLLFRADPDCAAPQRTYVVEHDALGGLEIFLVPVSRDADGMRYEAVFN